MSHYSSARALVSNDDVAMQDSVLRTYMLRVSGQYEGKELSPSDAPMHAYTYGYVYRKLMALRSCAHKPRSTHVCS